MNDLDAMVLILQGLGASEFIPTFKEHNIGLNTVQMLTDADLQYLGVNDEKLRTNLLKHGQTRQAKVCKEQYLPVSKENIMEILSDTNLHLIKWEANFLSACVRLKRIKNPIDPLVEPNLYSSKASLQGMKILEKTISNLENELKGLEKQLK